MRQFQNSSRIAIPTLSATIFFPRANTISGMYRSDMARKNHLAFCLRLGFLLVSLIGYKNKVLPYCSKVMRASQRGVRDSLLAWAGEEGGRRGEGQCSFTEGGKNRRDIERRSEIPSGWQVNTRSDGKSMKFRIRCVARESGGVVDYRKPWEIYDISRCSQWDLSLSWRGFQATLTVCRRFDNRTPSAKTIR